MTEESVDNDRNIPLPKDHSAIILSPEGEVVATFIPKGYGDDLVSRGTLISALLLVLPPQRIDALLEEFFPSLDSN